MTDTTDATTDSTPVDNTGDEGASTDTDTPEVPTGTDEKQDRRDARYRQRLRETEAERDALLQRVEHMQRGEVQRLTADRLADPQDLWRETELADLLDEHGNIDTTKVDSRVGALLGEHPHWATPTPRVVDSRKLKSGAHAPEGPRKDPWVSAFSPSGSGGVKRD